jgi:hypothetical protein
VKSDALFVRPDPDGRLLTTREVRDHFDAALSTSDSYLIMWVGYPINGPGLAVNKLRIDDVWARPIVLLVTFANLRVHPVLDRRHSLVDGLGDHLLDNLVQADFTYKITSGTISIVDTNLGKLLVTYDIEAVLRKIEYWHQGSIAAFKIMYCDEQGIWDGVRWDGQSASFFALRETDEDKAREKLRET